MSPREDPPAPSAEPAPPQDSSLPIAIGCDEAGYALKELIAEHLRARGREVTDYGTHSEQDREDYPDIAVMVAEAVARGEHERGVLICGTGIGMSIAANKVPAVRAAQGADTYSAERARKSNDAQIITMGARTLGPELARSIIDAWLGSEFEGGRSAPKVEKLSALDERYGKTLP